MIIKQTFQLQTVPLASRCRHNHERTSSEERSGERAVRGAEVKAKLFVCFSVLRAGVEPKPPAC